MRGWQGRAVLVVGLGASGFSAASALGRAGAQVRVTESSSGRAVQERAARLERLGIDVEVGGHHLHGLDAEVAVVSPGIPPSAEVLSVLRQRGVELISEIELAWRMASCDLIAVTGTNGKTTTTELLAAILAASGIESMAAGNIGFPLVDAVALQQGGVIAAEVSSFQLAFIGGFRPHGAVLLNVAEDHTDWHGSVAAYAAAKARITENQGPGDSLVFNDEDGVARSIAESSRASPVPFSAVRASPEGIGVSRDEVVWRGEPLMPVSRIPLPGRAGVDDTLAAVGAALCYGARPDAVVRAIESFRAPSHRLQVVGTVNGVTFIDDSKATNPHATLAAVEGLADVVLIAGGRRKGVDLGVLRAAVPPVVGVVALGEAGAEVASVFEPLVDVDIAPSMSEAVERAFVRAGGRGSVLLSPSCASLDMYRDYAARGEDFQRAVARLKANGRRRD